MTKNQIKFDNPKLNQIFNLDVLPKVTLEIGEQDWNDLLVAYDEDPEENFWVPGDFIFEESDTIENQRLSNIALRVRGNSSRNRPEGDEGEPHNPANPIWRQTSFALRFDRNVSEQTFEGLTRLDLKFIREDPIRVREAYSFDLYQQAEILSGPLISFCRFYIRILDNISQPAYFGIYKLKEFIEDDYIDARKTFFGDIRPGDKIPFLWKGDNGAALNNYDPSIIEDRDIYDLRINTSDRTIANAQLTDFVRSLVTLEGNDLLIWANTAINIPVLFRSYLINILSGNMDDYWYNANNYCFYFNTHGQFFFIPNDFDTSLGTGWGIDAAKQNPLNWGNSANPLIQKLLTIDAFKTLYIRAFEQLTNQDTGPFHVSKSIPRIQKWISLIENDIWDETIHFGCENEDAGCIVQGSSENYQTPFEDKPAWWTSGGNNPDYRLLEEGENNYFEVAGNPERIQ